MKNIKLKIVFDELDDIYICNVGFATSGFPFIRRHGKISQI